MLLYICFPGPKVIPVARRANLSSLLYVSIIRVLSDYARSCFCWPRVPVLVQYLPFFHQQSPSIMHDMCRLTFLCFPSVPSPTSTWFSCRVCLTTYIGILSRLDDRLFQLALALEAAPRVPRPLSVLSDISASPIPVHSPSLKPELEEVGLLWSLEEFGSYIPAL